MMQRTQQSSTFLCYRKPINAALAQLLEQMRPIAFSLEFQEIWQKKKTQVQKPQKWSITKIWILTQEIFYNTEHTEKTIYGELRKSSYV